MRALANLLLILSLITAAAAQQRPATPPTPAAPTAAALKQADIDFARATKERGLEGWMAYFAEDAYVGSNPSVQGKAALRKFYTGLFARKDLEFAWTPSSAELFPSGRMGYTSGRYTMSFTNYQGTRTEQAGSYLTVWQKQPDGSWKVLADFGSPDKPPVPPQGPAAPPSH